MLIEKNYKELTRKQFSEIRKLLRSDESISTEYHEMVEDYYDTQIENIENNSKRICGYDVILESWDTNGNMFLEIENGEQEYIDVEADYGVIQVVTPYRLYAENSILTVDEFLMDFCKINFEADIVDPESLYDDIVYYKGVAFKPHGGESPELLIALYHTNRAVKSTVDKIVNSINSVIADYMYIVKSINEEFNVDLYDYIDNQMENLTYIFDLDSDGNENFVKYHNL